MEQSGTIARVTQFTFAILCIAIAGSTYGQTPLQLRPVPGQQRGAPGGALLSADSLPIVAEEIDFSDYADPTGPTTRHTIGESVESVRSDIQSESMLQSPWWSSPQKTGQFENEHGDWPLEELIWLAIENSPHVRSLLIEPQIQHARASNALGEFDPTAFLDSIFHDTSDPVGNELITGSAPRLNDHIWDNRSGIRKKNTRGGQAEFSQGFIFKDSNSDFFIPNNQADTRMVMSYTQPLMRGAGQAYNRSSFVVANLNANQSLHEATLQIQQHVFSITNAYWELYAARAYNLQIQAGIANLQRLRAQLAGRADIDSLRSQLLRAGAAIARQRASLAQSEAHMRAASAKLRSAVAAPELLNERTSLINPSTPPNDWRSTVSLESELESALQVHPSVQAVRTNLKTVRVRLQVAEHELRPTLNLVLEAYLRGLNGDFNAAQSFGDQFSEGAPSYSAGLVFSRPYRNLAAKAILRERRLELRRTLLELDQALLTITSDVETAAARVMAAYIQLESTVQSTIATHAELEYLTARWQNAFLDTTQTSLMLDRLLSAQIQLIQAENAWARAQSDHMIALANLRLATGSILPVALLE